MATPEQLESMDAQQLRALASSLFERIARQDGEIRNSDQRLQEQARTIEAKEQTIKHRDLKIAQLTHEMAVLKRLKFAARSEQLDSAQRSLLEETIDADLAAMEVELDALRSVDQVKPTVPEQPKRSPLPAR